MHHAQVYFHQVKDFQDPLIIIKPFMVQNLETGSSRNSIKETVLNHTRRRHKFLSLPTLCRTLSLETWVHISQLEGAPPESWNCTLIGDLMVKLNRGFPYEQTETAVLRSQIRYELENSYLS